MKDTELLSRFIEGNEDALKTIVERHQRPLYAFIYRTIGNHDDTSDILQKVFVNVFLKAEQFEHKSSFKTWLYQIAVNQCKNHFRHSDRQRLDDEIEIESLPLVSQHDSIEDASQHQQQKMLKMAVSKLPEKQRLTMSLRLYQECTFTEIASIMSCSVGTAKACYHQAVKSLRKSFNEEKYESAELFGS